MNPLINQIEINSIEHVAERRKMFQKYKKQNVDSKVEEVTNTTDKKDKNNADPS